MTAEEFLNDKGWHYKYFEGSVISFDQIADLMESYARHLQEQAKPEENEPNEFNFIKWYQSRGWYLAAKGDTMMRNGNDLLPRMVLWEQYKLSLNPQKEPQALSEDELDQIALYFGLHRGNYAISPYWFARNIPFNSKFPMKRNYCSFPTRPTLPSDEEIESKAAEIFMSAATYGHGLREIAKWMRSVAEGTVEK